MADIIKKGWVRWVLSAVSYLYGALLAFLVWMSLAYVMDYDNGVSLFVVYALVNLLFLATMFLSRRTVSTAILTMLLVPVALAILLLNMGNWYMVIPPVLVTIVMFFAVRAHETLKTILGTIYLLMYVLSILAYIAFSAIMGGFDNSVRQDMAPSPGGLYRYVVYEDKETVSNRTIDIYVEPNTNDIDWKLVRFDQTVRAKRVYTGKYSEPPTIEWTGDEVLTVNGKEWDVQTDINWESQSLLSNLLN